MTGHSADRWRCVIVDDEPLARQTLRLLMSRQHDYVIVAECAHGAEAIEAVRRHRPDVLFLDVQMPEVDGFDVLRQIDDSDVGLVVFVTAYDKYALDAFERHAFDYLLKPFSDERFLHVIHRLGDRLRERSRASMAGKLSELLTYAAARPRRTLVVRDAGRTLVIPHEDIVWIEAEDYCSRLHLRTTTSVLVRESLRALGESLLRSGFIRVHRSAIANVDAIRAIEPLTSGDQRVTLSDGTTLKISRTHRAEVLGALRGGHGVK
jgi:two-component system, LytTR family, response regulator